MEATAVFVIDSSCEDSTGDEVRVWDVYLGDDDGEPVDAHKVMTSYWSRNAALDAADALSLAHGGLEVVEN